MRVADAVEAGPTLLRYRVDGMDCPSCTAKIETAMMRLGGAGDVRVSYQRQTLALSLDEAATPRAAVEEGIRKLGYGVAPLEAPRILANDGQTAEPAPSAAPPWWRESKARLAASIFVVSYHYSCKA